MEQTTGTAPLSTVARMRLNAQLVGLVRDKTAIMPGAAMAAIKVARIAGQIIAVLGQLGVDLKAKVRESAAFELEGGPEPVAEPRKPTAKFFDFDPNRKHSQRKKDNAAAMALLDQIDAGTVKAEALTDEQRAVLAKYSGTGGALEGADGKKGSAYEYYTPKPIAEGMWNLMRELGFSGGKVLDPSGGTGIFGGTAPLDAVVDAVELNETAGRINALVNAGPGYSVEVSSFERVAAATPDETYDAIATNVPFGSLSDRGGNELGDPRYQKEPLQNYFILRSLEKLKPGGLAVFITPPRCVSGLGGKEEDLRIKASYMAEFMGAYRLPNVVFGTAQADTITDVIVFRKFSRDAARKIEELRESAPAKLVESRVLWPEFVGGKYFTGEGKRFVLGEFVPKNPNDFRPVDRVISDQSIPNIAKLLRKFPGSRIDWALIEATETEPIVYADGDTLTQKGQTLQMVDGAWVPVKSNEASASMVAVGARMTTPLAAFSQAVTWDQAVEYVTFMTDTSQSLEIPDWVRGAVTQLMRLSTVADRSTYWNAGLVGLSVEQVLTEGAEEGANYLELYPALSEAMKRVATDAKGCPASVGGAIKSGMKALGVHYSRKGGYSGVWSGNVVTDLADVRNADQKFEGVKYAGQGIWVDREVVADLYGGAAFDPIADPGWCISDDGKTLARADDYFVGNYGDMVARLDAAAKQVTDPVIKGKLLAQRAEAERRVDRVDVSKVTFNLFSPYATIEEKAEFLRRFSSTGFAVAYDEETGKPYIEFTERDSASDTTAAARRKKLMRRMTQYLKNGTVTLGGASVGDEREAMAALRDMIATANEQFNGWCKANPAITGRLSEAANDPARLYFRQVEDESPLSIPGMSGNIVPHGYQNAFIRRMGRNFSGINGFGVGLGKTLSALASVAHVQNIGAKKKTAFIVPNSVLSNWRKEATNVYSSTDDCLFVGLTVNAKTGKAKVASSDYDRDLNIIRENRHRKIFMTMEAFQRLRLKDETIEGYERFMRAVDASFAESEDKKSDEVAKGKAMRLVALLKEGKSGATPFLEDLGIDSIVIDEAHHHKNSASTSQFKSAKFLALAPSASRGIDAQAKAWYIRGRSPLKDGVLLLTATPITNSPLEIYAMLSLAVGRDRVNDMAMGIKGADAFMEVMTRVESEEDETVDGIVRDTRIFKGLENVAILRKALGDVAVIKDADSVGQQVKVPDADEISSPVAMPDPPVLETLMQYKGAFRFAIDTLSERAENRGDQLAYEAIAAKFGEPMELIGHPFNLIQKMTMLIMDPELDQRATFYQVSRAQEAAADGVIKAFNSKKYVEERTRPGPHTAEDAVVGTVTRKDGDEKTVFLKIQVAAKRVGGQIIIDTIAPGTQTAFEVLADKAGLELDVTVPPKLAAMLANVTKEESNPRGVDSEGNRTPRVKQLIFCDILPLHNKIKRLLTRRAGIPAAAIAIITGQQNSSPDEIMAVQDGFNADGEDNKYRVVIANEKAEVGINLQRGTQAIHHLTIGWTPDSLTQRNGRGVRQGNKTERVTVYTYDADGTFDSHKRAMVSKKSGWIDQVMDVNGGDAINVEGGMSREQIEALIDTVGDSDAMTRLQERLAAKEREVRAIGVRAKQSVNIRTVEQGRKFLAENDEAKKWVARKFGDYFRVSQQLQEVERRLQNPKASAGALVKGQNLKADLEARANGLRRQLNEAMVVANGNTLSDVDGLMLNTLSGYSRKGEDMGQKMVNAVLNKSWGVEIKINDESALADEWKAEVDMTQAMVKEAQASFAKYARQDGGMPEEVIDKFARGLGVMVDGKPVVSGAFIRVKEQLGVVTDGGLGFVAWRSDGAFSQGRIANVRGYEVILPGSSAFDAAVTEAAQIEDAIAQAGEGITEDRVDSMFSRLVPAVSQRRTTVTLVNCNPRLTGLPAPYFPKVLTPDLADKGQVFAAIVAQQKAVVKAFIAGNYEDQFTVDVTVEVKRLPTTAWQSGFFMNDFLAFARANGLKINLAEAKEMGTTGVFLRETVLKFSGSPPGTVPFASVLTGEDAESLNAAAAQWVAALLPDVEMTPAQALTLLNYTEQTALQSAIKRAMAPPQVPVHEAVQALVAQVKDAPSSFGVGEVAAIGDTDYVGIAGNTKPWKEQIKATASETGGGFQWDGDATQWNVQYRTWKAIGQKFPSAMVPGQLKLVEFSGKYPRGFAPTK